ncbi:MAG: FAD-dependent oxidoreductase [Syntrophobacterales bacterium]|jgi:NADPH-dependent 2,4-dienoyl-CoA reductase/sulfur reductase-like enzyme/rhodanese-related sulfurtransferase
MKVRKLVIVGGVAGGASAAAKARRCSEEVEIIMYEKGPDISYANCGLPYYLSGVIEKREDLLITSDEFFRRRFQVDARTRSEVIEIDRNSKKVIVKNLNTGQMEEESYDRLILAPGSHPIVPPVPGMDLPFVFSLKTLEDTDRIFNYLQNKNPRRAVVVGGGLIGIEAVENLALKGLKTTVVELAPQVLTFLDWEMAEMVRWHMHQKGINLCLSEGLQSVEEQNGQGLVRTDKGGKIPADLVLVAIGVRPNVDLALSADLELGVTGGIKVNEFMQTSDPDIFAAGDCIETMNLVTGKPVLTPMGSAANKEGRAAGANALGRSISVKGFTGTIIVKVFDLTVAKTGLSEREAIAEGYSPLTLYVQPGHHAGYYPGSKPLHIKTVTERESGRLLGAQVIGEEGVDKRVDVFATAIYHQMRLEDLLQLDLAYAPPYSAARDPVIIAGAVGQNYYQGDWDPISPHELKAKMDAEESFVLVDVRTRLELQERGPLPGALHIPIDLLRRQLQKLDPDKETILYCAQGFRSYLGNRILAMRGFKRVQTLSGGMDNWMYERESAAAQSAD